MTASGRGGAIQGVWLRRPDHGRLPPRSDGGRRRRVRTRAGPAFRTAAMAAVKAALAAEPAPIRGAPVIVVGHPNGAGG